MQDLQQTFAQYNLGDVLISLIGALAILIIGYIVAKIVQRLVRPGLRGSRCPCLASSRLQGFL